MKTMEERRQAVLDGVIREFGFEHPITIKVAQMVDDGDLCPFDFLCGMTRMWVRRERERMVED